jgi:esterase/lipase superfamily enzyme
MKYYIVTNREILTINGQEQIDTTNDGSCTDNLRFAIFDSSNADPTAYDLIPDKTNTEPNQSPAPGTPPVTPYYHNADEPVKTGSEKFFTELANDMGNNNGGDLLVLIHGFNVDWASGIETLRSVESRFVKPDGSPIKHLLLFSWPSRASLLRYKSDTQDSITSGITLGRCFQLFSEFLMETFGGQQPIMPPCGNKIHLLCHSMGNRVLENILIKIMTDGNKYHDVFEEVILAASDVDNNIFENPNAFYFLNNLCRRMHVYCNRNDLALKFSAKYENPLKRLGTDGPSNLNIIPSHVYVIDCTDAAFNQDKSLQSRVIQHSYYDEVPEVSQDIYTILLGTDDEKVSNRTQVSAIKYRLNPL